MITGFSKLSKEEKRKILTDALLLGQPEIEYLTNSEHSNTDFQNKLEGYSENVISNYHLPFSVAPNFLINGKEFFVPMVTEESSVVAAAAAAAGFWAKNGGFNCTVTDTLKVGQIFFEWDGNLEQLLDVLPNIESQLADATEEITKNMEKRGGGIVSYQIKEHKAVSQHCFELHVTFKTADSMGANFINSCLEKMAAILPHLVKSCYSSLKMPELIMAILSNHTPDCIARCDVEAPLSAFNKFDPKADGHAFAEKFKLAVDIARNDTYRAVTHNKGIFNGVSAVLLATGNDFRAVEAAGHAYAVKNGSYASLSKVILTENTFSMSLSLPLAVGTVGGLTAVHPMAANALKILDKPDATSLMMVIVAAGLASNFSAIKALTTNGIQRGHMKMHLTNILNQFNASPEQVDKAQRFFKDKTVSVSAVREFLNKQQQL